MRKQELAPPQLDTLEIEKPGKLHRGTPSPSKDVTHVEETRDWEFQQPQQYKSQFSNSPAPYQIIHSQSQTTFDRCNNREDSPPTIGGQHMASAYSNPQLIDYSATFPQSHMFSAHRFQPNMSLYNCHAWQASSTQEAMEMYHSLPMPQTIDRRTSSVCERANTAEFPLPQRNHSDGEIKTQLTNNQKTVDFESPVAQTMDAAEEADSQRKEPETARPKSPADSNLSKSPPVNAIHRPNSLRGSLRRRNKSTGALTMKSSYEAYEERMLPALRQ